MWNKSAASATRRAARVRTGEARYRRPPFAAKQRESRTPGVVLVSDVPDERLEDVLERDHTGRTAFTVHHHRHVDPRLAHRKEELLKRAAGRNDEHPPDERPRKLFVPI